MKFKCFLCYLATSLMLATMLGSSAKANCSVEADLMQQANIRLGQVRVSEDSTNDDVYRVEVEIAQLNREFNNCNDREAGTEMPKPDPSPSPSEDESNDN